jgi:hypothetical protein
VGGCGSVKEGAMNFAELEKTDVTKYVEKKGQFSYLSWPFAVSQFRKLCPDGYWKHFIQEDGTPYICTPSGCFVTVTVYTDKTECPGFTQVHPVLDHRNKTVKEPDAFQINTSIQRCLVKAIALATGIGLHIYAGEDLPPGGADEPITTDQATEICDLLGQSGADWEKFLKWVGVDEVENIPQSKYNMVIGALKKKLDANGNH